MVMKKTFDATMELRNDFKQGQQQRHDQQGSMGQNERDRAKLIQSSLFEDLAGSHGESSV